VTSRCCAHTGRQTESSERMISAVIPMPMFMTVYPVYVINVAQRQVVADVWTKPIITWANRSAYRQLQWLHSPSSFIISTQLDSWYSFHRLKEGITLSRPRWLVTLRDGLFPAVTHPGTDRTQGTVINFVDRAQRVTAMPHTSLQNKIVNYLPKILNYN